MADQNTLRFISPMENRAAKMQRMGEQLTSGPLNYKSGKANILSGLFRGILGGAMLARGQGLEEEVAALKSKQAEEQNQKQKEAALLLAEGDRAGAINILGGEAGLKLGQDELGRQEKLSDVESQREFTSGEREAQQRFSAQEALKQRGFQASESAKGRQFQGAESALNRNLQKELKNQDQMFNLSLKQMEAAAKQAEISSPEVIASEFVIPAGTDLSPGDKSEIRKQARTLNNVQSSLDKYKNAVSEVGPQFSAFGIRGEKGAKLQAAQTELLLEAKNLAELGALSGPDMDLINNLLVDPSSVKAQRLGKEGLLENLNIIAEKVNSSKNNIAKSYDLQTKEDLIASQKNIQTVKQNAKRNPADMSAEEIQAEIQARKQGLL